jgi:DNA polymerase-3 subunit alpha
MGKKKPEEMAKQEKIFIDGAVARGFDREKAKKLFELMAFFAGYGFNKSHSTAYALIAYQTAYLKAHYPTDFEAALLSFETGDPDKLCEYLNKASQAGVKVCPPNINRSGIEFMAIGEHEILFGLKGIKNLGDAALHEILQVRQKRSFNDLFDFCKRVNLRAVNKRVIESLICAGAMDGLAGTRAQKFTELEEIMALAGQEKDRETKGQIDLFMAAPTGETKPAAQGHTFKSTVTWSMREQLAKEKEMVGFYLSAHPLDAFKQLKKWVGATDLQTKPENGASLMVLGLATQTKTILTKKNERMVFMTLEDKTVDCEVIIFPSLLAKVEKRLAQSDILLIIGQADGSADRLKIKAQEIVPIEQLLETPGLVERLEFSLPQWPEVADLQELQTNQGLGAAWPIRLFFVENGQKWQLRPTGKFGCLLSTLSQLAERGWEPKIVLKEPNKPVGTGGQRFIRAKPTNIAG